MASSSSSSRRMKYQVFLSFRGEDTRLNFTTHLLKALKDGGLEVFFDEEKLEKGETLSQALSQATAASNISVIVLSKDYASSKSCLAELYDIMSRNQTQNYVVLPIFYHVDPSDVKNLVGSFKSSFEKHESKGLGQVQQWKAAFAQVGHLKGWHIEDRFNRPETEYIKDIVGHVIQKLTKHQIFLSFKAEDTGLNFTGHLLKALENKGINVLSDNETLSHKYQAIAASKLSIIVLSVDYASSESCLAEVSDIMRCKESKAQIVLPIFYHVDPSHLRNIGGSFKTSFEEHKSKRPIYEVKRWKVAFAQVGQLKGWHIVGGMLDRSETEYIRDIVEHCIKKLDSKSKSVSEGLIGIEDQKETILRLIEEEENRVIGLWGMGGSGKTTLAEVIYNEISPEFEAHCFVQNVREKIEKQGMELLRNDLLSKLLNSVTHIDTPSVASTSTQQRLENKRVMVVLDDVKDSDQIVGMGIKHFGPRSKIIVTARDKQELENGGADKIHKVEMLNVNDSLQLFSMFAFKQLNPVVEFRDLSNKFAKYAQGCPLALKVLGSRLYKKSRKVWESEVVKLKEYVQPKISQVLERSFHVLDELEKKIFLDIAIFYKGEPIEGVEAILSSCYDDGVVSGISSLVDKCLLEVIAAPSNTYPYMGCECIFVHDMLEEMAKDIVRQESANPFKRSRLCVPKDVFQVLANNKGTGSIEGIKLEMTEMVGNRRCQLCPIVFQNMHNLKYINFVNLSYDQVDIVSLPDELRYIRWVNYPSKSLPSSFNPKNLVVLKIRGALLEQLWNDEHNQDLVNLRQIQVSHCVKLRKIPNLFRAKKLEILNCNACFSLVELPRFSLTSLQELNVSFCQKLEEIPNLSGALNLKFLNCYSCESLVELPCLNHLASLEELELSFCTKLRQIPHLSGANSLKILKCHGCSSLVELPCLNHLASLEEFELSFCIKLRQIPHLSGVSNLKILKCQGCSSLVELPYLNHLTSLEELEISFCTKLRQISHLSGANSLKILKCRGCSSLVELPCLNHLPSLEELELSFSTKLRQIPNLWGTSKHLASLGELNLDQCRITEFPKVPRSLTELDLSGSDIERLSLTYKSNLRDLNMRGCSSIQKLQCNIGFSSLKKIPTADVPSPILRMKTLHVSGCYSLELLSELPPYLQNLDALGCISLKEVSFTDENLYQFDSLADVDHDKFFMVFSDCSSLNQDSVYNIEANAMLKIRSLAQKSTRKTATGPKSLLCCYPGNEISANNFEYQSEYSVISFKISPNECGGSRFLAFSICIVVRLTNFEDCNLRCFCRYILKTTAGASEWFESNWDLRPRSKHSEDETHWSSIMGLSSITMGWSSITMGCRENRDHVCILYNEDMVKKDENYKEASFRFYMKNGVVKKCGIHVLYMHYAE